LSAGEPIDTTGLTVRQTDELTLQIRNAIDALREDSKAQVELTASARV
jgi:hypothetical protein